jgi:hypothetical protein
MRVTSRFEVALALWGKSTALIVGLVLLCRFQCHTAEEKKGAIVNIDDIIIACSTLKELRRVTETVFQRLRDACLYIKASKCKFKVKEVKFLGVLINSGGVKADPGYVQGILDFPAPTNLTESRQFVGMAGYYCHNAIRQLRLEDQHTT